MAESHINDEFNNPSKQQVDQLIAGTAQYISAWTQREFAKLANNKKLPLIWPLPKGGYIIGKQRVISHNGYWQLQNSHGDVKHTFDAKQSAIFCSLCEQINQHKLADAIRTADYEVLRYKNDIVHFEHSLRRAEKRHDSFGISIWSARLDDAKLRLSSAQNQLQKSIKSAKYLKVWDN